MEIYEDLGKFYYLDAHTDLSKLVPELISMKDCTIFESLKPFWKKNVQHCFAVLEVDLENRIFDFED